MTSSPSVLIVDRSADNREVLRTVLERQGLRIYEAPEAQSGLDLVKTHQPDVIVLDAECDSSEHGELTEELDAAAVRQHSRLVILGRVEGTARRTTARQVAKPYHFGPLIHTIQQLAARAA